ncbi:MAG TPA: histidine phosphatase family protein [Clostridiales bacterium]|nr:histidine phosphatase family protein [Clostridiales bacterium]
MLRVILLRHFPTSGNLLKRYIGVTDEGLCQEEIPDLEQMEFPQAEAVFVSPLVRCRETARLVYPELTPVVCEDFRECDFGEFENKNYLELADNEKYQKWVDSGGTLPFPGGEAVWDFKERCIREFQRVIGISLKAGYGTVAFVVHGGTIMSILEQYADPRQDYYAWHTENGNGYVAEWKEIEVEEAVKEIDAGKKEEKAPEGRLVNICSIR